MNDKQTLRPLQLEIVQHLKEHGPSSMIDIAYELNETHGKISHHLGVLQRYDVVACTDSSGRFEYNVYNLC